MFLEVKTNVNVNEPMMVLWWGKKKTHIRNSRFALEPEIGTTVQFQPEP